jgi:MFS family permease
MSWQPKCHDLTLACPAFNDLEEGVMTAEANAFQHLDEQPIRRFHLLALVTTGMGVFTDGYDLSSVGVVLPMVLASFGIDHISGLQSGLLAGSALVGAAIGALLFGALAQRGRKRYYGMDVGLMAVAAAAQIFAPNLWSLIAIRFVLGIGIGADYVLSPTIMAEHANRRDRGKKVAFGFGVFWCLGAFVAALVLLAVQALGFAPSAQWRIVLAAGAIPALSVLYLRRRMPETARYLARVAGDGKAAREVINGITGSKAEIAPLVDRRAWQEVLSRHLRDVFGAALLWLVYDIVIYSSILFGPSVIAQGIGVSPVVFQLVSYGVFIIPGTILGVGLIDSFGRKPLLALGFTFAGGSLALFALLQQSAASVPLLGLALFGLYNFTISLGPGAVSGSGLLGVELSPTRVRSIAQSVTVVGGRIGASTSAFLFPLLLGVTGVTGLLYILAVVSIIGAVLTLIVIPEPKGRSLEEINGDSDAAIMPAAIAAAD